MNITKIRNRLKSCLCFLIFTNLTPVNAQIFQNDTLKIMSYNTLNYGFAATTQCPALITANKHNYLKTIIQYSDPDILGLVKMDATPSSFSTDSVIQNVLDSLCSGCYGHSQFTNLSGYSKCNMLYFKLSKIGYVSTSTIYSADPNISDINLIKLFYKDPNISINLDTIFVNIILVHLKSGTNNDTSRANEIAGVMSWLNNNVFLPGNYIIMGDFNVNSSTDSCFQELISSPNPNTTFFDPENQLGNWAANPALYSKVLTQSTRKNDPGDCGSTGGMNSRFDHILCSYPIMQGNHSIRYLSGSFEVLGQDGNHVNKSLLALPADTIVPPQVLNSLYYMSSHLPVSIKVEISSPVANSIKSKSNNSDQFIVYPNPVDNIIHIKSFESESEQLMIILRTSMGNNILERQYLSSKNGNDFQFDVSFITPGFYFLEIRTKELNKLFKLIIN